MFFLKIKATSMRMCVIFVFATLLSVTSYAITPTSPHLVTLEESFFYDHFYINLDKQLSAINMQSLAHYKLPGLQENCINTDSIKEKIHDIGEKTIEKIIDKVIRKEMEFCSSHYVFYHGCSIEFLLFQDILKHLTKIKTKKMLDDFFLLRIPTALSKTYTSVEKFLEGYSDYSPVNDSIEPARSLLLSVNPSLFGNTVSRETSSAFYYFLSSSTAFEINSLNLIAQIFDHYSLNYLYKKYEPEIRDLYATLAVYEPDKTGILMQILIPKNNMPNTLTYRSEPRGIPYYKHSDVNAQKPSTELEAYQKQLFSKLFSKKSYSSTDIDTLQYRILLNEQMLLPVNKTPKTSIKIKRYFNKTPKIKEYKAKLKQLCKKITYDWENK